MIDPQASPRRNIPWSLVILVGVIIVIVVGAVIFWWQRNQLDQTRKQLEKEIDELQQQVEVQAPDETAIPTPSVTASPSPTPTPTPTAVDNRILLTPENVIQYCDIGNAAKMARCGSESFNFDAPTETVTYRNETYGIQVDLPYNPKWGSVNFRVNPYDEDLINEDVFFGPIGIGEGGGWGRMMEWLSVEPAQPADQVIAGIGQEMASKPQTISVADLSIVRWVESGIAAFANYEVIGQKRNYRFITVGSQEKYDDLETIVKTMQLID
jgi:hypothetical protein